ncbi:ATP-binding protein [Stakelama sediminis]|uniref:histidine kinase n=1 Tax=Stakelama sediminis TaxID=463200 RepID=A0A840Z1A1_9SPHN|nr:ATP-binding protein [Stakelama sediminis]MBB5719496.1 signal transduction histidine kinase [Stakelama sediminis]
MKARRWPLFWRIFGLMLLTLLLVQAINFALVMLMPPPQLNISTLPEVAAALRGKGDDKALIVSDGEAAVRREETFRDKRLEGRLALMLGVPAEDVRIRSMHPHEGHPPDAFIEKHRRPPELAGIRTQPFLFGDFTVSARVDGTWRTVRPRYGFIAPWRRRALLWLVVAILVVAPFAWLLAHGLARPIRLFASAAERLGRDPKAPPLAMKGPPEISDAAAAFNEMQARLNRYVEDRTTLMAAIAHDLRTPLMRMGLRLEHAPPEVREACEDDIRDMEHMIAAVMAFVRDMARTSQRHRLDLRALAESVTDGFSDAGGAVMLQSGGPVVLDGDAPALKAMLSNLIGNALNYAGSATVSLGRENGSAVIEVRDTGPGMAPEDIERAFEPFFRAERSRNRDTGGIGLGLASARTVARAHGGDITLSNRSGGGLLARVTLPV